MRALLIPPEGKVEQIDFEESNPNQWHKLIGGNRIDYITLREVGLQVLLDDRSIIDRHPPNPRATWFVKGTGRWLSEIHGTVLIVGVHPETGETTHVHDVLCDALVETH